MVRLIIARVCMGLMFVLIAATPAYGQLFETFKFEDSRSLFGTSVDLDGDHLVVSSLQRVILYNLDDQSLMDQSSIGTFSYGTDIEIDGDVLYVGEYTRGRIYLHDLSDLSQFELIDSGLLPLNTVFFGSSIAVSDGTVVAGASGDIHDGVSSGGVYLYNTDTSFQRRIVPENGQANDLFGSAVDLQNGLLIVGARGDDDKGDSSGAVYVYTASDGNLLAKLYAKDASSGDQFGFSVSASNDYIVVGSRRSAGDGVGSGAAYVFDASSLIQISKLTPLNGSQDDLFGSSIAVSETGLVVVGAPASHDGPGAVYVFSAASGRQLVELSASDGNSRDRFGASVSIQGSQVAVGATGGRAAYYFEDAGLADCDNNGIEDSIQIASNQSLDCNLNGALDSCEIIHDPLLDCDANGILDVCEIADDPLLDCDENGLLDACEIGILNELEVVVLFDTSGSMGDDAAALCGSVTTLEADLMAFGFDPAVTVLGITNAPGGSFSCLSGSVSSMLGSGVPGGGSLNNTEDWGDAAAVVAERFPWIGGNRIVVVISDEAPQDGDPCDIMDQASIDNAVLFCSQNGVQVVGVSAQGSSACVEGMMQSLASGTGGTWFASTDPNTDLVEGVSRAIRQVALSVDCNDNGVLDSCEIADGIEIDCNNNGVIDSCEMLANPVLDCDANGVLDECQVPGIVGDSGLQGPIGFGLPTTLTISNAPDTSTDVSVRVTLSGDFAAVTQIALFKINGQQLDVSLLPNAEPFFAGSDVAFGCADMPSVFVFTIPALIYNASLSNGNASFEVFAPSPAVSINACPAGVSQIEVQYYYEGAPDDCNGNGRPDLCDLIIFGGDSADDNFNFIPDECEGVECLADLTGEGVLNFFDVSAFLQGFGNQDPVADFTDDGVWNFFDVSAFLQAFGAGCP